MQGIFVYKKRHIVSLQSGSSRQIDENARLQSFMLKLHNRMQEFRITILQRVQTRTNTGCNMDKMIFAAISCSILLSCSSEQESENKRTYDECVKNLDWSGVCGSSNESDRICTIAIGYANSSCQGENAEKIFNEFCNKNFANCEESYCRMIEFAEEVCRR